MKQPLNLKRIRPTILKLLAALLIAWAVWFILGAMVSQLQSIGGNEPQTQSVNQRLAGSVEFLGLFLIAAYLLFRPRGQKFEA